MSKPLKVVLGRNRLFLQSRGRSIEVPADLDPALVGLYADDSAEQAAIKRGLALEKRFREAERAGRMAVLTRSLHAALN